ncbi:MAG: hypothetical protein ACFE96_10570, partial [Candidatus Hermodarchaeota archaeon]
MMKIEPSEDKFKFFDYRERLDDGLDIKFEVNSECIVNAKASIQITFTSKKEYPRRTLFRFVIPYGWEPITLKNDFCSVLASIEGKIKSTHSSITLGYIIDEPMKEGDYIQFNYNLAKSVNTAGEMAYIDKVYCALDIKLPREKLYSRIGIKQISMLPEKVETFLIKIPTLYHEKPVDI